MFSAALIITDKLLISFYPDYPHWSLATRKSLQDEVHEHLVDVDVLNKSHLTSKANSHGGASSDFRPLFKHSTVALETTSTKTNSPNTPIKNGTRSSSRLDPARNPRHPSADSAMVQRQASRARRPETPHLDGPGLWYAPTPPLPRTSQHKSLTPR